MKAFSVASSLSSFFRWLTSDRTVRRYLFILLSFLVLPQTLLFEEYEGFLFGWGGVAYGPGWRYPIFQSFASILLFPRLGGEWRGYSDPFLRTYLIFLHLVALLALLGITFHRLGRISWFPKLRLGMVFLLVSAITSLAIFNHLWIFSSLPPSPLRWLGWMFYKSPFPMPPLNFLLDGMLYGCYKLWTDHLK